MTIENVNISDFTIFIDEGGVPSTHDPKQSWLIFAGVSLPSNYVVRANEYFDACIKEYIPNAYLQKEKFEIKGSEILHSNESKRVFGMDFQTRIKLARELLCMNLFVKNVEYYVTALNIKEFHLQKDSLSYPWGKRYLSKKSMKVDLLSLAEIVGDFCFKLEHAPSQQSFSNCQTNGYVVIDQSSRYKKAVKRLEKILREERNLEFSREFKIHFQLVKDNVVSPFEMDDSKRCPLIQIADTLAALVRSKYEKCHLPNIMEELFLETRISFQNNYHFYPSEPVLDLSFLGTSIHRLRLLEKAAAWVKEIDAEK